MKILIISPRYLPNIGGQELQVALISENLQKIGADVTIWAELPKSDPSFSLTDFYHIKPERYLACRYFGEQSRIGPLLSTLHNLILCRSQFDLIIVRTFSVFSISTGLLRKIRILKPKVLLMTDSLEEFSPLVDHRFSFILKKIFGYNDYINAPSNEIFELLNKIGFPISKITKLPNAVDFPNIEFKEKDNSKIKTFGYLGNVVRSKGVFDLLNAFCMVNRTHPYARLIIGGEGVDLKLAQEHVSCLGIANAVEFRGSIHPGAKYEFLNELDCFVFPTHNEGFGLTVLEAACVPLEIISTDTGAAKEILGDRCHWVEIGNIVQMSEVMIQILDFGATSDRSNLEWQNRLRPEIVAEQIYHLGPIV